jgi:rfaE bifunctional protein kinase chain/domain
MSSVDISKFQNKRILVIGDIMLDEFLYTISTRHSPEYKNVPIYDVKEKHSYLGGAANVALNIKSLGAIPYLVGVMGSDVNGKKVGALLKDNDITQDYLFAFPDRNTTTKTRVINNNVPVLRIDDEVEDDLTELTYNFLLKKIGQCISNHKPHAILLQDYNKGVLNPYSIQQILSVAKEYHIPVCVDPKFKNWENYQDVELFKPNKNELKVISGELKVESENIETIAKQLQDKIHFKNLLVTLASEGNFIYSNSISQLSTTKSQIVNPDVCGAGDTVIAVATLGLVCGFSLEAIAELANKAGAIVCQKKNVQPVTLDELMK